MQSNNFVERNEDLKIGSGWYIKEDTKMAKFTQSDAQIEVKDVGLGKTFKITQAYGSREEDVKVDTINLTAKNAREIAYAILIALGEK